MKKPATTAAIETPLASCWIENDILCVVTNNDDRTKKSTEEHYRILKENLHKKFYWLVDLKLCRSMNRDVLDTIYDEIPKVCKGMAVIAVKPCERMVASYFLRLENKAIPSKMFLTEKEARSWLKEIDDLKAEKS